MKIANTIKQLKRMKMDMSHSGDEYNAIQTAIKSLEEWKKLLKELEDKDYILMLNGVKGHITKIEE